MSAFTPPTNRQYARATKLNGHNALSAPIRDVAHHGHYMSVHVDVEGMERPLIARLSMTGDETPPFTAGKTVWCNRKPEHGRMLTRWATRRTGRLW